MVTDSDGRPVSDLTSADFDLVVDRKPVPIASLSYVKQRPRRLVLVVDDAGLSSNGVERVRAALTGFVNQQMQAGDEAAILRTRSGSSVLEAVTSDKHVLSDAINQIQFDPAHGVDSKARDEFVLAGMATTLRRALAGLGAISGRKALVLITGNLALARRHPERFERFAALAAYASVVFYALDMRDSSEAVELDTLMLAGDTGGLNLGPELSTGLARVLQDQQGYYLLGFQSLGEVWSPQLERAVPFEIKIQAKDTSVLARARSSPLGSGVPETDFRDRTPGQELTSAINSPFAAGAIHVLVSPIFGNSRTLGSALTVLVWIDAGDLTFTHQLNGLHKANAQLLVSAFGNTGMSADQKGYSVALQLSGEEYQRALQQGWLVQAELRLPAPGVYQVRAAVRDETSSRMGTASHLVEMPDLSSGALALSSIAIHAKDTSTLETGPARRIFAPGATLDFVYQILNPSSEELQATLRLFRGAEEIFTGSPQILPATKLADPARRAVAGEVRLGTTLPAGNYWLQVTVADRQSGKLRQARQWIDFQVR